MTQGWKHKKPIKTKESKEPAKKDSSDKSDVHSDRPPHDDYTSCDGSFKFFKVGKASPFLEFTTVVSQVDFRKSLVRHHMVGIELFGKFPACDLYIHLQRKEKRYTAHTTQQWQDIHQLPTRGYSLIGESTQINIVCCL